MPRKLCHGLFLCAAVLFVGGCPFIGLEYEEDLVGDYAVWATDAVEQAAVVRKEKGGSLAFDVVPSMVFAYGWNDDFIIAKRHPQSDWKVDVSVTNWYIVEVKTGKVHGPLSKDEFGEV